MSRERINDLTEASELAALANNPGLTLDVTDLDLGRLPAHVKAALYTEATTFSAPQLQTSEYIYANNATSFSAPQLKASGDIYVGSATTFSAPRFQTSGDINANNATNFSAPQLKASGDITAPLAPQQLQKRSSATLDL